MVIMVVLGLVEDRENVIIELHSKRNRSLPIVSTVG